MNVYTFTGRLGNPAELRHTANGKPVLGFSVAVESGFGDNKKTTWVKCSLWGKRAEGGLSQYLVKGTQVAVSGEACLEEWESNGKHGAQIAVNVGEITLIGGKTEPNQEAKYAEQPRQSQPSHGGKTVEDFDDDDVPF